mmetsp:Transcript_6409/g.12907  ORF Transcript_6409/g.12907 Transcript_6409/m.12907 type:complete len:427 (+) Transcript_6409:4045-5325(+)
MASATLCSAYKAELSSSSSSSSSSSLSSILDDGKGHINSELARAIYDWEMAHRESSSLLQTSEGSEDSGCGNDNETETETEAVRRRRKEKRQFSTRDGLRLVDELARDVLQFLHSGNSPSSHSTAASNIISHNDLVQEGMIALLRSMSTYDNYLRSNHQPDEPSKTSSFEQYAETTIRSSLLRFLATSSRPIRLPSSLPAVLRRADAAASELRLRLGREPTLLQVARAAGEDPDELASHRALRRRAGGDDAFVGVEDGVETRDPTSTGVGVGREGVRLESATMDANADSSLRDLLVDTEEINNPLSYTHHHLLNESLDRFLSETLSERESEVIRWRFGLVDSKHGGRGWKFGEICERTGMEREEVVRIATVALEKLREAAKGRDRGGKDEDEGEGEDEDEDDLGHLDDPPHLAYWEDDDPFVEVSL